MSIKDQHTVYQDIKPLIFWDGFPPCALLTKSLVGLFGSELKLLGTHAAVPFKNLEEYLNHPVRWLSHPNDIWAIREEYSDRNFIIHTCWCHNDWLKFDRWMRPKGAKIVCALDNTYRGDLRQYLGALWFRLWLRQHFDAVFVPGHASTRFMQFMGMPKDRIFPGFYGATEQIYTPGPKISERPKEFLYIGQLIHRKGVDAMLKGFSQYRETGGDWSLRLMGSGPMENLCCGDGVIFEGFGQPDYCAYRMRQSRCLVLLSRDDHWGTVVCEAAASGTVLLTSSWVGASDDIVRNGINGIVLTKMNSVEICEKFHTISAWETCRIDRAGEISIAISKGFNSISYKLAIENMIQNIFSISSDHS